MFSKSTSSPSMSPSGWQFSLQSPFWRKFCLGASFTLFIFFSLRSYEYYGSSSDLIAISGSTVSYLKGSHASGFLPFDDAARLCHPEHWEVYPHREHRRKVYDLFIVNTELDWLEIRMGELEHVVDYFVIVEAATTFTDQPKPLHMQENWGRYSSYHPKIIHHVLNTTALNPSSTWDRESFQRNAMYDQVLPFLEGDQAPQMNDVIIVSDIDEIPRPEKIAMLRNCRFPKTVTLDARFYYYSFQWQHTDIWTHPQATYYDGPQNTIRPQDLRHASNTHRVRDAAWHCSYCFARLEDFVNKITSFSHTEFNTPEYRDRHKILHRVRTGEDLFGRPSEHFERAEVSDNIPQYLQSRGNKERFLYMLDRDPMSGNFLDYREEDTVLPEEA